MILKFIENKKKKTHNCQTKGINIAVSKKKVFAFSIPTIFLNFN